MGTHLDPCNIVRIQHNLTAGLSVRVQWTSERPLLLGYPLIKNRPVLGFSWRALSYAKKEGLSSFGELNLKTSSRVI